MFGFSFGGLVQAAYTPAVLDAALTTALGDAVHEIELRSCAEVVVEVRSRSGSYAQAEARFGALLAFVTLLILLFSPWPFAPWWVAVDVAVMFAIGHFVAGRSDVLRRAMTRERERLTQVRTVAAAVFHERGVANTERETGLLVYLSLLEKRLEVLADRGVLLSVPALPWNELMDRARTCPGTPQALLAFIRDLGPMLAEYMPAREGDVDELANAPRLQHE